MKKTFTKKTANAVIFLSLFLSLMLSSCTKQPGAKELREKAINEFDHGDYETAKESFTEALNATKRKGTVGELQFDILKYRAECELRTKDYEAAEKTYDILLKLDKKKEDAEEISRAAEETKKFVALQEICKKMENGKYEEAYDEFSEYASLDGSAVGKIAWYNQAICAEYLLQFDEAYTLFSGYCSRYPDDEKAAKEKRFCETRI